MATLGLSGISAVLNLVFGPGISETLRRDVVLPNIIRCVPKGNSSATWKVKIGARNTAGPRAEGAAASGSDFSSDTRLQGTLPWAHYESFASITGTAQRIQAANGQGGGMELLAEELRDASNELAVGISEDVYSGNSGSSPAEIEGLARAVDSTGTYAGIAQGTYATWASGEATGSLSGLTLDGIRTNLFRPVKDATGKRPDVVVLPGNLHDKVAALIDSAARVLMPINAPVGANGAREAVNLASMGFTGFMLDGVPFVEDRHCTANTMYALTLDEIEFQQTPPIWTSMDPGQLQGVLKQMTGQDTPLDQIMVAMASARNKISFQVNALAKSGDSTSLQIVGDVQLCVNRRNAHAKYTLS